MELLQNRRYRYDKITDSYIYEIRMQIECLIELCREGEIPLHEAKDIIIREIICFREYKREYDSILEGLEKKIEEFEKLIDETEDDLSGDEPVYNKSPLEAEKSYYEHKRRELIIFNYDTAEEQYIFYIKAQEKIEGIKFTADYLKNRKEKIKQQILRDGVPLYPPEVSLSSERDEKTDTEASMLDSDSKPIHGGLVPTTEKTNKTYDEIILYHLYPEFKEDFSLLFANDYLDETEKGFHWKKAKQALAEYFESIKPSNMKEMKWKEIEKIFEVTDLKNCLSRNGNIFKNKSKDFKKWLEIKNKAKKENESVSGV